MRILAFDTTADYCSLALAKNGTPVAQRVMEAGRGQAAILAPMAEAFLKENGLRVADLDRLAVCTGPGSFTGIRIGLAFARGLSLASRKPLFGFDHFALTQHALARRGKSAGPPLLMIRDSKRAELFASLNGTMFLATLEDVSEKLHSDPELLFTGDGAACLAGQFPGRFIPLPPENAVISAALLAGEAKAIPAAPPEPLYLRDADVTFPKAKPA